MTLRKLVLVGLPALLATPALVVAVSASSGLNENRAAANQFANVIQSTAEVTVVASLSSGGYPGST